MYLQFKGSDCHRISDSKTTVLKINKIEMIVKGKYVNFIFIAIEFNKRELLSGSKQREY